MSNSLTELFEAELLKGITLTHFEEDGKRYIMFLTEEKAVKKSAKKTKSKKAAPSTTKTVYNVLTEENCEIDTDLIVGFRQVDENINAEVESYKPYMTYLQTLYPDLDSSTIHKKYFIPHLPINILHTLSFFNLSEEEYYSTSADSMTAIKSKMQEEIAKSAEKEKIKIKEEMASVDPEIDLTEEIASMSKWLDDIKTDDSIFDKATSVREVIASWPVMFSPAPWEPVS